MIKAVVAVGMLWWLLQQGALDFGVLWQGGLHLPLLGLGLLCNLAMISLGALRWQLLLGGQGIHWPFAWVHRMIYLTVCFNLLAPGSVGGDALRMGYVVRRCQGAQNGAAILTILVDRLTGLYALFVIALLAALGNLEPLLALWPTQILLLSLALVVVGLPLLLVLLFWGIERIPGVRERLESPGSPPDRWLAVALDQTALAIRLFRRAKVRLIAAVGVSMLAQAIEIIALLLIAQGLGLLSGSASHFFVAAPVAWVANLLPISPGGLGVGEAAFAQVCQWLQPTAALTALGTPFLINRLLQMVASLPGLWVYLLYRHDAPD
ncbi:MAG: flippase-like domain-containing protein [Magnetococcales bacterium]|nr:flippase-like domain-containing protein [Magnetococcales bacterium]MBF0585068.1 flippase-like domain-containing protein [Magnetococcales bacterium]